jgi:hypothetical protein
MATQPEVSYDDVLNKIEGAEALIELLCDHDQISPIKPETLTRAADVIRRELHEAATLYTRLCEERGIVRKQLIRSVA